MKTNTIIDELRTIAEFMWGPVQKAYYQQKVSDAKAVKCVRMRDVFTRDELGFINEFYNAEQHHCYRNASTLIKLMKHQLAKGMFNYRVRYVEGYASSPGFFPIEHAFVKIGSKYIDPTFEKALKLNVRKEMYVSLIELEPATMMQYELETGCYGELYKYDYYCKHDPGMAARIRSINPNRDKKKPRLV